MPGFAATPTISTLKLDNIKYYIKDAEVRQALTTLIGALGEIAYSDVIEGSFTPQGTISTASLSVTASTVTVLSAVTQGVPPVLTVDTIDNTILCLSGGTEPTFSTTTVINNVTGITGIAFTGTPDTITLTAASISNAHGQSF